MVVWIRRVSIAAGPFRGIRPGEEMHQHPASCPTLTPMGTQHFCFPFSEKRFILEGET